MAKRKKSRKRSHKRSHSLRGIGSTSFEVSRINTQSVLNNVAKPVLLGFAGAAVGHFIGKGANLLAAAGTGLAATAMGYGEMAVPVVVGMAAVTPPRVTISKAGIDGIDGLKDYVSGGVNRTKGYAKSLLSNMGLTSVADKIPVSGFSGLDGDEMTQQIYDQGYMAGIGDLALLDEPDNSSMMGLEGGFPLSNKGSQARSIAASVAANMGL